MSPERCSPSSGSASDFLASENDDIPPEKWSVATKTIEARMHCACAGCGKAPGSIEPLPDGWYWDTMEPTNNWVWCPVCWPLPNGRDEQRAAERADDHLKTMTLQSVDKTPEQLPMRGVGSSDSSAWVRCEDRHPALGEIVWLWEEGRGPWIGSRDNPDNEGWLWGNAYGTMWHNGVKWDADVEHDDEYKPTHWQPLPLLPNTPVIHAEKST